MTFFVGEKSGREVFSLKKTKQNSGYMYTGHQEKSHASLQTFFCVKTLEYTSYTKGWTLKIYATLGQII